MNIFVVLLIIGGFAWFALNAGERERPGWAPVGVVLIIVLLGFAIWPEIAHIGAFLGGR